ncbi:PREDICTED: uncharacterized protein LOC108562783 [Nicrophorus vespilloides]|uniref:Uncharacterized protein LOC108562783 n=1 Tax=Nicrophorus vespilloides TaxID=110193 RepID=A0ABM1MQ54_NICVS|nr:PREDICTED: uncharacterized protein LOC108562783 [Nicrophorus vespilloides]
MSLNRIMSDEKKMRHHYLETPKDDKHYIVFNLPDCDLLGNNYKRKADEDSFFFELLCEYRQREIFNLRKDLEVGFSSPTPDTPISDRGSKLSVFAKIKTLGYLEKEWDSQQYISKYGSSKKMTRRIFRFNPAVTPPHRQIRWPK